MYPRRPKSSPPPPSDPTRFEVLVWEYNKSCSFNREVFHARTWLFAGVCLVVGILASTGMHWLEDLILKEAISAGYKGDPAALCMLDKHFGYTPDNVDIWLDAWGFVGRMMYLGIQNLDAFLYITAYRGILLVILNRAIAIIQGRWPKLLKLSNAAFLPVLLASADYLEDFAQVGLLVLYDSGFEPPATPASFKGWRFLVYVAAFFNIVKWVLVAVNLVAAVPALLVVLGQAVLDYRAQAGKGKAAQQEGGADKGSGKEKDAKETKKE